MPCSVKYEPDDECIYVTVSGELDEQLFKRLAFEAGQLVKEHGCRRILNDMREAVLTESAGEIYFMPRQASSVGVGATIRRALVVKDLSADFKFMENVFVNQGNTVKFFTTIDEAKKWLFNDQ